VRRAVWIALAFAAFGAAAAGAADGPRLEPLAAGVAESLRGLSVVDDRVAWVSGTRGHVGRSTDGGATWTFARVPGFEERDFRDVEGFSAERALVVAVASPGVILETADGGASWTERFRDQRPGVFLDGLDCAGGRCAAFGDPLDGRFQVVVSEDGGRNWHAIEGPAALDGEAAFAASGRSIRIGADGRIRLGTGGAAARVLVETADGWQAAATPLAAGEATRGVFALAEVGDDRWVAVGGDFRAGGERAGSAAISDDGGRSWRPAGEPPGGYRSAVERIEGSRLLATGPSGTDESDDGGATWRALAPDGFHVVARARSGRLVLLAGADGRLARLRRPLRDPSSRPRSSPTRSRRGRRGRW
jgi:photosystem II stability/assembly factor-like uncharacterized protein